MKIGIFTDTYTPDINGVVSSVVTLQKGLEAAGHEVYIITGQKNSLHATREGNVLRMPGLELKRLYGYTLSTPYHSTVKAEVEKLHLDIIHVQQEFTVGMFGRMLAHSLHIPIVYTYHTMYEDYTHYVNIFDLSGVEKASKMAIYSLSRHLCNTVSGIIAPSEKTKEKLIGYGVTRPIYVIPTGLNLDQFKKENVSIEQQQEVKERYHISEETKLITYLGRIANEKSIDFIVEGAAYIKNENCKIMIVGGGPSLEDLKKQAHRLGLDERIIFTGAVVREEVPVYYQISDAFVSASTSETQGMTFIEALASGLCIFARKDEVLDHLVIENETGFYFETPEQFGEKVDAYLAMEESVHQKMSLAAIEKAQGYDMHTFAHNVVSVYEKAIEEYYDCYLIRSIKACNDYVKLYLDAMNTDHETILMISLDDYILYQIKKGDVMESYLFTVLKDRERVLQAYQMCIKKLRAKDRTRKEMYDFLINQDKVELSIREINDLIAELENKGYINNEAYMITEIQKMDSNLFGKKKILRKLIEKGIPYEDVERNLSSLEEDEERVKAEKLASKYLMTIKNKSVTRKKSMMVEKLHNDGFSYELAKEVVNSLNYEDDLLREGMLLDKAVEKAIKNYTKKYSGIELRNHIISYALNKGFLYDDIIQVLEERKIEND